jgi:hypothetical protein
MLSSIGSSEYNRVSECGFKLVKRIHTYVHFCKCDISAKKRLCKFMLTGMAKLQRFDLRPDDPGSNPARMTGWIFDNFSFTTADEQCIYLLRVTVEVHRDRERRTSLPHDEHKTKNLKYFFPNRRKGFCFCFSAIKGGECTKSWKCNAFFLSLIGLLLR